MENELLEALKALFRISLEPMPKKMTLKAWEARNSRIDRIVRNALNKAEGSQL
jgi:hypothetical protein